MAARRLLIVMLILLGLSTLAAALVPPKSRRSGDTTSTPAQPAATTRAARPAAPPEGEFVPVSIVVGGKTVPVVACRSSNDKSRCSPIRVGDQISLTIRSRLADQLEIPAF